MKSAKSDEAIPLQHMQAEKKQIVQREAMRPSP
jgi:hypothetical protein